MRKIIVVGYLTICCFGCIGQNKKVRPEVEQKAISSSHDFDGKLEEYRSDCMDILFKAIAKSNEQNYPVDTFFYSVSLSMNSKTKRLEIEPQKWFASSKVDYKGLLKQGGATFLLRGNFASDTLFLKTGKLHNIRLMQMNKENESATFLQEPILQGFYLDCESLPIYIEVYALDVISGFKMVNQGSSIMIKKVN